MFKLSALLSENGLPDRPILLIEPHRNNFGIWRIKFSYDDGEPLSMNVEQASKLAVRLHQTSEDEMACEIDEADLPDGICDPRANGANRLSDTAALFMALGGGWPAACTTPVWRDCAMGEGPGMPNI